jgi:hypothetical protein
MPVGDIAVLRAVGRYQDQNIVNTMHYEVEIQSSDDIDLWQQLADDWASAISTLWLGRHIDAYSLVGVKVFTAKGNPHPPGFTQVDGIGTVVGTGSGALLGRTITLYTDDPSPAARGRVQLSGGTTDMFDPDTGQVVPAEITLLNALGALLTQIINEQDNEYKLVVFRKLPERIANIVLAKGRITPSVIRSRRARVFTIG